MDRYRESPTGLLVPPSRNGHGHALGEAERAYALMTDLYEATIADLRAQIQEAGWLRLDGEGDREFSRDDLGQIVAWARAAYLKNPLVRRGVEIAALYVWGQDLSVNANDDGVEQVVDRFWRENRATLTGQQASRLLEVELDVTGNVFLALFPDPTTGLVRVRPMPMEEVQAIVANPDDRAEPWYYRRRWNQRRPDGGTDQVEALYPDWRHRPASRPATLGVGALGGDLPVRWESPVLHVKTGAFAHWAWGVPEVYAALDWATAYKRLLEDDATRSRSLARFAWQVTTKGGRAGVAAAKARLGTTLGSDTTETNPPPGTGSAFVAGADVSLDPIRIAGATLNPEHSRPARLMASAGLGISDHFFDADVGNFATARTLDRPTELRFSERRQFWRDVYGDLLRWVIDADIAATGGLLRGRQLTEEQRTVDLSWPDLLEPDVTERVTAVVDAATLAGREPAGTLPAETTARLLMGAIGVDDIDGELERLAAERAAREERARQIARRTQPPRQPQAPAPGGEPGAATEALAEAGTPVRVVVSDDDIAAAEAFWDDLMPEYAGMLSAKAGD